MSIKNILFRTGVLLTLVGCSVLTLADAANGKRDVTVGLGSKASKAYQIKISEPPAGLKVMTQDHDKVKVGAMDPSTRPMTSGTISVELSPLAPQTGKKMVTCSIKMDTATMEGAGCEAFSIKKKSTGDIEIEAQQ